jgi:hypothetical protein
VRYTHSIAPAHRRAHWFRCLTLGLQCLA